MSCLKLLHFYVNIILKYSFYYYNTLTLHYFCFAGFTLTIKLKMDENNTRNSSSGVDKIEAVKNYVASQYNNVKLM